MAPEQVSGQGYGFGVDYWSLGILLFAMLCVETPFAKDTAETQVSYLCIEVEDVKVERQRYVESAQQP